MFSKHPYITNLCRSHGIIVESNYRHNRFNLPILRNLILYAQSIFTSKYYGYINSDVLISPDVFEALRITALLTKTGKLRSAVGPRLAFISPAALHRGESVRRAAGGRVAVAGVDGAREAVAAGHSAEMGNAKYQQRRRGGARGEPQDVFFFSRKYPVEKMQSAVVGRRKIDSYIMYFTILKKIPLIDLGKSGSVGNEIYVVTNLHQGRDTYNHHSTHRIPDDFYYNGQFYDDRNQRKATLTACDYRFSRITGVGLGNRVQRLTNV